MMRRSEREVRDPEAIRAVIAGCSCLRLGLYDDGEIYIVPVNFGYLAENGRDVFYFHGAAEKARGLQAIMAQATGRSDWEFPSLAQTCVWRLDADKLSCKANI